MPDCKEMIFTAVGTTTAVYSFVVSRCALDRSAASPTAKTTNRSPIRSPIF
ncbi:MAG: hypothetical protein JOZ19_15455 [Rubrobacter sp.]|nr:hypothetical protein [Rubrobacter sp.]